MPAAINLFHLAHVGRRCIVTGNAGRLHRTVIHAFRCEGSRAAVAERAFIPRHARGRGSRNVIAGFAERIRRQIRPIVAHRAIAGRHRASRAGMAHRGRRKRGVTLMADIALCRRRYMRACLCQRILCCVGAVVARGTVACRHRAGGAGMAHCRGSKGCIALMAKVTLRRGRNMDGRLR